MAMKRCEMLRHGKTTNGKGRAKISADKQRHGAEVRCDGRGTRKGVNMKKLLILIMTLVIALTPISVFGVSKAKTVKYIKHYSKVYNINARQAVAIAKFETGHFTSYACRVKNNVGGMMGSNGLMWFKTRKAGCKAFCRNIRVNYKNCGLMSTRSMSYKYCPTCPEYWTRNVKALMR